VRKELTAHEAVLSGERRRRGGGALGGLGISRIAPLMSALAASMFLSAPANMLDRTHVIRMEAAAAEHEMAQRERARSRPS
jgi:hypothetical protein